MITINPNYARKCSAEEVEANFKNSLVLFEKERNKRGDGKKHNLDYFHRMELATRLCFAEFLKKQKRYEEAKEQVQAAISRATQKPEIVQEENLYKCRLLIQKIDELSRMNNLKDKDKEGKEV